MTGAWQLLEIRLLLLLLVVFVSLPDQLAAVDSNIFLFGCSALHKCTLLWFDFYCFFFGDAVLLFRMFVYVFATRDAKTLHAIES